MKTLTEKTEKSTSTTATRATQDPFFQKAAEKGEIQMADKNLHQPKPIVNGGEIVAALGKNQYGLGLIAILENSGLEYIINIQSNNSGKFGDPKKILKDGVLTGYQLNFQKYNEIELAGTRYDHAGKDEYYGGIAAHDVIDTATPEGIAVNVKKDEDWANPDSDFRKSFDNWDNAKAKNRESAKTDFFQFLIDNYEKTGMDAELKFRDQLGNNTLDTPIGELSQSKGKENNNPNLKGKTPRDIYTKGLK